MSRFKSADERHAKGRTAWAAITVTLWQHSLTPALERLQSVEETVTSFKEAVERARRHEAARLPGGAATISVMSFTTVSNHAAVRQLQSPRRQQRQQGRQQGGRQQGGRQRGSHRGSQHQRKPRPHCAYDRCEKPVGHWESTYLQKARDIRGRRENQPNVSNRDPSSSPRGNLHRFRRHHRYDDEEDDNADEEAGSTHGDEN